MLCLETFGVKDQLLQYVSKILGVLLKSWLVFQHLSLILMIKGIINLKLLEGFDL